MSPELAKFLESIQKRAFTGGGIGTAAGYVLTVVGAAESEGFCRQFPGKSANDFRAMLKAASEKLVHRPDVREPLTSITKRKKGKNAAGEIVSYGSPKRKDANTLTKSSVMDFENILTTKEKDRDGDILHPKGGKIDPAAPLLWQHIPTEPIGKLVQVVEQDDDHIKTHCAIADTVLGNDAAALVEFGALRISHGFKPLKWKALSEGDESGGMITGWEVEEWEGMEISLVSVPANVGAVITAFSRQKLHSPLIKSWAGSLYEQRPLVVRTGFGVNWKGAKSSGVTVNVNMPAATPASTPAAPPAEPVKGTKPPADPKKKGKKAPEQEEDDAETDDPKQDESEDDDNKGEGAGNLLSDVAQRASDMAEDESLSNEVRARCNVVAGILNDVGTDISAAMEKIQTCAESQDLAGLAAAHQELIASCGKRMQRAAAELASLVQASDEMDDGAAGAVQEMAESIGAALSGIMPAQDQDPAEGGTGDWTQTGNGPKDDDEKDEEEEEEDDDEDDDEDSESEDQKDDDADDEEDDEDDEEDDEDDSELEEDDEKDDDDSDDDDSELEEDDDSELEEDDEKDDEEDDREEKDDWEVDPDEENPHTHGQENPGGGPDDKEDMDDEREDKDEDEDDDSDEKDAADGDDDEDDEPKKKPKKKPKAADLTTTAKRLTAAAIEGQPFKLKEHRDFAAAVMAGGNIDPAALIGYREVCGPLLGSKKKR